MRDLAPGICRQRAIIEGIAPAKLTDAKIREYLSQLAQVLDMVALTEPVTHRSPKYGEAAWVHWETSGAHFYAWDEPVPFFSVDIYTCKPFELSDAVNYTRDYFACRHGNLVFKSV
ncbi:S-adenosylmethionine decarboxylase [Streptomyces sp. NPDC006259]|uniref:S-adenosylmethionine decarboxylase n=1 Tax=Streptomyces sp. NPDC006259 TaxID=3364740 RepID=UPI00369FE097